MTINSCFLELASVRLYEAETSIVKLAHMHGMPASKMIDFSLNINPFGSPSSAVEAATRAITNANFYPDVDFLLLRQKLANKHGIDPDRFFFGSGLDDVIKLLLHALSSEKDTILIHLPTFPRYALEAKLRGCEVIGIKHPEGYKIDLTGMREVLQERPVAMAFICTPNNPTGEQVDSIRIAELADAFPETIFVVDEALIDPRKVGAIQVANDYDNVIVLRTFSKFYGLAGLRVGYAICSSKYTKIANVGRPPFNLSISAIHAAVAALDDDEFIARCARTFAEEVDFLLCELTTMDGISMEGNHGNMVLLSLESLSASTAAEKLAKVGIVVADATSFEGLENTSNIRISLRQREENLRLISALRHL